MENSFWSRFSIKEDIGKGGYGQVYKVYDDKD
jgi:serine/threonine protein kinase